MVVPVRTVAFTKSFGSAANAMVAIRTPAIPIPTRILAINVMMPATLPILLILTTAGFRWAIGKEGKPLEKVQSVNNKVSSVTPRAEVKVANNSTVQPERKIIKQLTPEQRVRLGARPQDTTRTTSLGSLRQI